MEVIVYNKGAVSNNEAEALANEVSTVFDACLQGFTQVRVPSTREHLGYVHVYYSARCAPSRPGDEESSSGYSALGSWVRGILKEHAEAGRTAVLWREKPEISFSIMKEKDFVGMKDVSIANLIFRASFVDPVELAERSASKVA